MHSAIWASGDLHQFFIDWNFGQVDGANGQLHSQILTCASWVGPRMSRVEEVAAKVRQSLEVGQAVY